MTFNDIVIYKQPQPTPHFVVLTALGDFDAVPLLCHIASSIASPSITLRVWVRRLTKRESYAHSGLSWGVCEIVAVVSECRSPSSSRSTPEADREDNRQTHHLRFDDDITPCPKQAERMLADSNQAVGKGKTGVRSESTNAMWRGQCSEFPDIQQDYRAEGRGQGSGGKPDFSEPRYQQDSFQAKRRSPLSRHYDTSLQACQERSRGTRNNEVAGTENNFEQVANTGRRSPSPSYRSRRDFADQDQALDRDEEVILLGVITAVVESINDSEFIGYVWTRDSSQAVVLHLGSDPHKRLKFSPGHWIEFIVPEEYARAALGPASWDRPRLEISVADCRLVPAPFKTIPVGNSVEMEIAISLSISHRRGDDYMHCDLGAIADPRWLLEGGRDYILRVTVNRPVKAHFRQEAARWKILDVVPVGESWGPRHTRKQAKAKRPLPSCRPPGSIRRPNSTVPGFLDRNDTNDVRGSSPDAQRAAPARPQGSTTVAAKPLDTAVDDDVRQRVTDVAMVETYNKQKGKYRLWLTQYHTEAEFCSNHVLKAGHFFQGRFSIGGKHKNKCHDYLQEMPTPEGVCGYYDTEAEQLELYVEAMHKNRKNGACYEVYHKILGFIRDSHNLLSTVDEPTPVAITARRLPCAAKGGQLTWQICKLGFPVVVT